MLAVRSLTSRFGWDVVHSTSYGRKHFLHPLTPIYMRPTLHDFVIVKNNNKRTNTYVQATKLGNYNKSILHYKHTFFTICVHRHRHRHRHRRRYPLTIAHRYNNHNHNNNSDNNNNDITKKGFGRVSSWRDKVHFGHFRERETCFDTHLPLLSWPQC